MFKVLLALLLVLGLFSVRGFAEPTAFDKKFNLLEQKMTPAQVKDLIGAPDLREVKGDEEVWTYNPDPNTGRRVVFKKGHVQEFGREESHSKPVASPTPTPTPLVQDLGIGEHCSDSDQCHSKNCHFSKCSGSNNCSVPLGKRCAIDGDCCGGFCDFGTCKKKQ